ncbi:MAG: hypothetical protein L7F77_09010 [Candidatus Magnetominusculus sp. LBB02]|nr:hypothetical protein [Candidatus Magnetominusculus sp. LBB02]
MPEGVLKDIVHKHGFAAMINRFTFLLIVSAVMLAAVTDVAAKCEDTYYYASFHYRLYHKTYRVRAFDMTVDNAYIYDFPKLPSSWIYVFDSDSDRDTTHVTATAKSDKHTIRAKDLEKFVIFRQPKDIAGEKISIIFNVIYMKKEGGIGTDIGMLDNFNDPDFDVEKINKCLPKKPRRH